MSLRTARGQTRLEPKEKWCQTCLELTCLEFAEVVPDMSRVRRARLVSEVVPDTSRTGSRCDEASPIGVPAPEMVGA